MGTITARMFNALGTRDIEEGAVIPVGFDAYNQEVTGELSKTVAARNDQDTASLVAHTLRGAGFDASEDGTGRGTPLVPVHAFDARQSGVIQYGDRTGPLDTDGHTMAVAINLRGREGGAMPELSDLASLRAASGGSSRSYVAAIHENQRGEITTNDTVGALNSGGGKPGQGYAAVAFTASEQANSFAWERDYAPTLNAQVPNDSSNIQTGIRIGMQVRRLTPRECERLQGFPDDYTLVPHRGKPAADGPRYKALGNSMAVPVMAWIGRRIAMVDAI
jgi:DNA (cytosine-5)-methyltransferase 1